MAWEGEGYDTDHRRSLSGQEEELEELAGRLILRNPEAVVVTDEVGCGIVPLEPFERDWREQTGRICTRLAAASRKVYRVILGIGKEIKG